MVDKKMSKKEKEWLKNPTIEINMNNEELEIVGNPFDKDYLALFNDIIKRHKEKDDNKLKKNN